MMEVAAVVLIFATIEVSKGQFGCRKFLSQADRFTVVYVYHGEHGVYPVGLEFYLCYHGLCEIRKSMACGFGYMVIRTQ